MANAGTVTVSDHDMDRTMKRLRFTFTTTSGGAARLEDAAFIDGIIRDVFYVYDDADTGLNFKVQDADGVDVLQAAGNNMGTSTKTLWGDAAKNAVGPGLITLDITSGGNAKSGTIIIYWR